MRQWHDKRLAWARDMQRSVGKVVTTLLVENSLMNSVQGSVFAVSIAVTGGKHKDFLMGISVLFGIAMAFYNLITAAIRVKTMKDRLEDALTNQMRFDLDTKF